VAQALEQAVDFRSPERLSDNRTTSYGSNLALLDRHTFLPDFR
jgi:hypothetical protein